jgi:histidyl-tRNA synthetase
VRGIDYYTRTVFEFTSDALGAQSGVGGGGRYDGLIEQLGGRHTPGVGWAAGIERILLVSELAAEPSPVRVFISYAPGEAREAFALSGLLRERGVATQMEQAGRSLKGQLKHADRLGAAVAVLILGDSWAVRDMKNGTQQEVRTRDEVLELLGGRA